MSEKPDNVTPFASGENGIIKSPKDLLIDAEKKIGEMENERRETFKAMEILKWQNAQLRVAVTAIGSHFNCPPEDAKVIIDAFIERQEQTFLKANAEAKAKFIQDVKDGKKVEFETTTNPEARI